MPSYAYTLRKIRNFESLPEGWHYGEGVPASQEYINTAEAILDTARRLGFSLFDAFPGVDGQIQLTIYDQEKYIEITLESDETITLIYEIDRCEILCRESLSVFDMATLLEEIALGLWDSSESFIQHTLTSLEMNLKACPSTTQAESRVILQYPYSKKTAQKTSQQQPATILPDTILIYPETPPSTGMFQDRLFPAA